MITGKIQDIVLGRSVMTSLTAAAAVLLYRRASDGDFGAVTLMTGRY